MAMETIDAELSEKSKAELYPILASKPIWEYTKANSYMLKKVMGLYQIDPQHLNIAFFLRLFGWLHDKEKKCLRCYFCGQESSLEHVETQTNIIQDP